MGIYSYFISAFNYILGSFDNLVIYGGVGLISFYLLLNILVIIVNFFKRAIK